jgi:hypothetical protein
MSLRHEAVNGTTLPGWELPGERPENHEMWAGTQSRSSN